MSCLPYMGCRSVVTDRRLLLLGICAFPIRGPFSESIRISIGPLAHILILGIPERSMFLRHAKEKVLPVMTPSDVVASDIRSKSAAFTNALRRTTLSLKTKSLNGGVSLVYFPFNLYHPFCACVFPVAATAIRPFAGSSLMELCFSLSD